MGSFTSWVEEKVAPIVERGAKAAATGGASELIKPAKKGASELFKPAKKAGKKIKDQYNRTSAADIGKYMAAVANPVGGLLSEGADRAGYKDLSKVFSGTGAVNEYVGGKYIDLPKAEKAAAKRADAANRVAQQRQLARMKRGREIQEGREDASESLRRGRRKQDKRRASAKSKASGRGGRKGSTLLTSNLGEVGGEESGRKTILGG